MAKAIYTTSSGSKVTLEGSPDEVAQLLGRLEGSHPGTGQAAPESYKKKGTQPRRGVAGYVLTLRDSGYLRSPRKLGEIGDALSKDGHTVPVTVLAVALLRLVRAHELQRIKDGKAWKYGNR